VAWAVVQNCTVCDNQWRRAGCLLVYFMGLCILMFKSWNCTFRSREDLMVEVHDCLGGKITQPLYLSYSLSWCAAISVFAYAGLISS